MKANTQCEIEQIKHKHAPFVNEKALKYLNTVSDAAQYPGARVDVDFGHIIMYQCSASLAVESMNQANKAARDRTAVNVVCATKLLWPCQPRGITRRKKWHGNGKGN
jgi:hypothetical protein